MRILVADDDDVPRSVLCSTLAALGYETVEAEDGAQAWGILDGPDAPMIAILDWVMPAPCGIEICARIRSQSRSQPPYLIILTSKDTQTDLLEALDAGADEFLTKPVDPAELRSRIEVGRRMVDLQRALAEHAQRLQSALDQVKRLEGILPICSYCKKIRNDQQYWLQVEQYISDRTDATFSHGICPECWDRYVKPEMEQLKKGRT